MFSPEIKGKDMTALNDLILSNIESFKLKGIVYNGVDYFQFATINKENNMDFYNKLKKKFGFDAHVNPRTVNVVDTMALTYIDKINASWMKTNQVSAKGHKKSMRLKFRKELRNTYLLAGLGFRYSSLL